MDGCADAGGCFELPFLLLEPFAKDDKNGGCFVFFLIIGVLALGIGTAHDYFYPPPPPPPPRTLQERTIGHPINRWKIERAEKKYWEEQRKLAEEAEEQARQADIAPETSQKKTLRQRWKDFWSKDE